MCLSLLFVVLLLSSLGTAQLRDRTEHQRVDQDQQGQKQEKKKKGGPRAIAVLEFLPGGGARLVPVALRINGRFYDASLYGANPEPMALEPETMYQAMNYGEPTGWFTVTTSQEVNGNWVGEGRWKPVQPLEVKLAEQAAKQPKPKPKPPDAMNDDQGPPVLRRPGASDSSSPGQAATSSAGGASGAPGNTPVTSDDDSDRPTLKASPSSPSSSSSQAKPSLGGNPDRSSPSEPSGPSSDENDPNRPVLRRGKPASEPPSADSGTAIASASMSTTAKPEATAPPASAGKNPPATRAYAAISDAGDYETRSLLYAMGAGERESLGPPMEKMALDEIRNFISKRKAPPLPKTAALTDYDLRGFDLDYSNSPTLVLSGKLPVAGTKAAPRGEFDYFVTVVARLDINGVPQKIFSLVTDSNHLDAFPRMQVIDAVDADANGRGDLLFRHYSDTGISYALYRVSAYQMDKIFEGGAGM